MPEYKSLYIKWRPKIFTDVYGQEHITKVLQNQVANQKVSHAYLFTGTRGTGKTTCARILAKAVNCENPDNGNPCNKCETCTGIESGRIIDVIEIDAASNNGVENIRDIRDDVAFTPGGADKKVYIIDEVHMMSTSAFNAFLKTLEEPPAHIIFILATTEINKVPATILSRCQRHDFKRISPEIIAQRLNYVCKEENIEIEEKAVDLISRLSGGALRDALSILETCSTVGRGDPGAPEDKSNNEIITFEYVSKVSGYFDTEKMVSLCVRIKDGDAENALRIFWEMYDNSLDCNNFCMSLLEMFRNIEVAKIIQEPLQYINLEKSEAEKIIEIAKGFDSTELLRCNTLISEVIINLGRYTVNKRVAVEVMLVEMCMENVNKFAGRDAPGAPQQPPSTSLTPPSEEGVSADFANPLPPFQKGVPSADGGGWETKPRRYFDKYADLIEEVSKENKMIVPYLKSGKCIIDGAVKKVIIYVDSEFKANILKDEKNLSVIQNNLIKFTGREYSAVIELQKTENPEDNNKNSIDDIINSAK
ncbi:MAG: DNA polymerase III subunit gamma/tau [Oscillospiraceae bacterium]|nr:DNA polymerase III subunit gamma/tau [Oscillospiraceae bacterium]